MPVLHSAVDPHGKVFADNRTAMLERIAELDAAQTQALAGGGERYTQRHHARGKLLARERIELLVDRDAPFLELMPVAAYGSDYPVGAGVVTGIGIVSGVPCMIIANDPTVRGGAVNPYTLKKTQRAGDIAAEPTGCRWSTWSSRAGPTCRPRPRSSSRADGSFRDLTRLSAAGMPDRSPSCSATRPPAGPTCRGCRTTPSSCKDQAKVFLGGPPLVKMATGEETDDETLGGAVMHATQSGLADFVAVDERDAIRLARDLVRRIGPAAAVAAQPPSGVDRPATTRPSCSGSPAPTCGCPTTRARCWPGSSTASEFDEFKPAYGTALVTGWATLHGYPIGVLANARGVLFSEEAQKAAQFIQLANSARHPAAVPAEHDRLHGRHPVRAGRHHQARRADDQRGVQLRGAAPDAQHRRVVRGRQLRHVRPGLRPAVPVRLAATRSRP